MTEKEIELTHAYARLHGSMLAIAYLENLEGNTHRAINICQALKSSLEKSNLITKYEWMAELDAKLADLMK